MSLTLAEARARAAAVSDVHYEVELDLTGAAADPGGAARPTFGSRTVVTFACAQPSTFLELTGATELRVSVDGVPLAAPAYDGRRLVLTGLGERAHHRVEVEARLPYVTDGDGLHRMTDPADGETYVGAYVGMDIAQKVFCCFDQNDLKARLSVQVLADPRWTVLANGLPTDAGSDPASGRWCFATTPPVPVALFVVLAGPFASVRWEHAGLPFGWHARASLAGALERDAEELRRVTEQCFDHYAALFAEPYPFDSYDQAFVPGLNWGAQEMPGCVTYRDEMLPVAAPAAHDRLVRAMVIAHEMSHMWFGDLATMTWWEDTWLQESFADYMGFRVAADAAGFDGAQAAFEVGQKPGAYDADARRSTHPVAPRAEDVPDVDAAATIFDAISYGKGNAVLRQLVTWLGDEAFLAGVNLYLHRHRFGNATLEDLLAALEEAARATPSAQGRDVRAWAEVWLRQAGTDAVVVHRGDDVPVLRRRGVRPHRFTVTAYDEHLAEVGSRVVELGDDPVALVEFRGRVVVPNAHGESFVRVEGDEVSESYLREGLSRVEDPLVRAVLWARYLHAPADDLLAVVHDHLGAERAPTTVAAVVARVLRHAVPRGVPIGRAADALAVLAAACGEGLAATDDPDLAAAFLPGWTAGSRAEGALRGALARGSVGAAPLVPAQRWAVLRRLAVLGAVGAAELEAERSAAPGLDADLGLLAARASLPSEAAKAEAWSLAADPAVDNRRFAALMAGIWTPEHAPAVEPYVGRYLAQAPGWAARGQAFAQVVGRARPAFRPTDARIAQLRAALAGDLPVVLRRHWEDWLDDLA